MFFPYEWYDQFNKMQNTELFPYDGFYSKLRNFNPFETDYVDYVNFEKWIDPSKSPYQIKTIKATTYWKKELSISDNIYGSKNKWVHSKTFCGGITIKMLFQLWRQCKKVLLFATTKIRIC